MKISNKYIEIDLDLDGKIATIEIKSTKARMTLTQEELKQLYIACDYLWGD